MTEDLIREYWSDLPREMRIELLVESDNKVQMLNRAAKELDIDIDANGGKGGHLTNEDFAEFVIAVMDKLEEGA